MRAICPTNSSSKRRRRRPITSDSPSRDRRGQLSRVVHRRRVLHAVTAVALVALGGAIGSVVRYALSTFVLRATGSLLPLGTFVVNVAGSVIFGGLIGAAEHRFVLTPEA